MAMIKEACVERIIDKMTKLAPPTAFTPEMLAGMQASYNIIVGEILDEVRNASVTLNFANGSAGAPVATIVSPSGPVSGVGVFSPVPGTNQFGVLS